MKIIYIFVFIVIIALASLLIFGRKSINKLPPENLPTINIIKETENDVRFTGVVETISPKCWSDSGNCEMLIDGAIVVWGRNLSSSARFELPPPENRGTIQGVSIGNGQELRSVLDALIGKKVEVFAKKTTSPNRFSIIESEKYYIKEI